MRQPGGQGVSAVIDPQIRVPLQGRRRKPWLYGSLAVVIVLGGGAVAYSQLANRTVAVPQSDLYTVGFGDVTQTVSSSATVQAPQQIQLNFTGTGGILNTLPVQIGQNVQQGQVLATLNDATQQIQQTTAEASVEQAEANLIETKAKLTQAQEPPTAPTLAVARASVAKARSSLAGAKLQYRDQLAIYNNRSSSEGALASAQSSVTEEAAAVQAARINLQKAKLQQQETENGGTPQDISVLRDEVTVAEQAITSADQQLSLARQNLAIVQQTLQAAEQTLSTDVANNASATQIQADESAVRQAQQSYNSGESAVVQNDTSLTNDQVGLVTAEKNLADGQPASNTTDANLAANAVTTAQVQLQQAQLQYNAARQNLLINQQVYNDRLSSKQALDNAQNAVQQDEIGLQSAVASLQETEQPPDPAAIQSDQAAVIAAQAAVQSAQAQLQTARLAVSDTVLTAPISGVVTTLNGAPGEAVSSSAPVVVIDQDSTTHAMLNIQVPESEIGSVQAGEAITATTTAFPTESFSGKITQVYPTPQVVSNVTEYTVMATVSDPKDQLRTGLTANVTIDTQTATHTLVVPAISLTQLGTIQGVYVLNSGKGKRSTSGFAAYFRKHHGSFGGGAGGAGGAGGGFGGGFGGGRGAFSTPYGNQVRFQPVTVGLFGVSTVQVTGGLQAGEQILLVPPGTGSTSSTTGAGAGRGFGGLGGGFGGGFGKGGFGG